MNAIQKLMLNGLILSAAAMPSIFRVETAQATVRVHARIVTPNLQVEVGPRPVRHMQRPIVVHEHRGWDDGCVVRTQRLSLFDRQVAHRLSTLSGIPRYELMRKRANGQSWDSIARQYRIARPVMKAALDPVAYERYLAHHSAWERKGHRGHGRGRR